MNDLRISGFVNEYNYLIMSCDESYKNQFFQSINDRLQTQYQLKGPILEKTMKDLKKQFKSLSPHMLSLKKCVLIVAAHQDSLRSSEYGPLVASKLHELMEKEGFFEGAKITKSDNKIKQKASELLSKLESPQSEKEIRQFFDSNPKRLNPNMKRTLRDLDCSTIQRYARLGIIKTSESVLLWDELINDLMTNFSPEQRTAFYQGLVEMKNRSQSFRQLFCILINSSRKDDLEVIFDQFPDDKFVNYLTKNLIRVKEKKIKKTKHLSLDKLIIESRMQRAAQIVIRNAIRTGDYAKANHLLIYMHNRLKLNEVTCDLLSEEQRCEFVNNSSLPITLKPKPSSIHRHT